jgi:hypothetical protein
VVLKTLRLEIKAANHSLPVSKANSLDPWAHGQIFPLSLDGTNWPLPHPDTLLIKMMAPANSSHQLIQQANPELGRDCWICLRASQVSYAGVGLPNISEIHRLGLDNSTQHDNTCLTGMAVQINRETKCSGKGKSCTNLLKRSQGAPQNLLCLPERDPYLL